MTPTAGPAYVAAVLMLYLDLPDTPLRVSPQDQSLAAKLHEQGVPLSLVEAALLLASLRRLIRPADRPPLRPFVRSPTFNRSLPNFSSRHYPMATSNTFASNFAAPSRPCRLPSKKIRFLMIANVVSHK